MAIGGAVHSYFALGGVRLENMVNGGLLGGLFMVGIGLLMLAHAMVIGIGRFGNREERLLDKSTFIERIKPERDAKQAQSLQCLFIGFGAIAIAGIAQVIIHYI